MLAPAATLAQQQRRADAVTLRPLPAGVIAQRDRIRGLLPPGRRLDVERLVPAVRDAIRRDPHHVDARALASAQVRTHFPHASSHESDVLTFTLLAATYDSLSDTSTDDQMIMEMDQRAQFEAALSNMLKTLQDTDDGVIANMKG